MSKMTRATHIVSELLEEPPEPNLFGKKLSVNGYPGLLTRNTTTGKPYRVTWFDELEPTEPAGHFLVDQSVVDRLLTGAEVTHKSQGVSYWFRIV